MIEILICKLRVPLGLMLKVFHLKTVRLTVAFLILASIVCRGFWTTELARHDGSHLADPFAEAMEHGHYHAPRLNHLHDSANGMSDELHPLIHSISALDHQSNTPDVRFIKPYRQTQAATEEMPIPPPPAPAGIYRPPKTIAHAV